MVRRTEFHSSRPMGAIAASIALLIALAADAGEIGVNDFRVSEMGPDGSVLFGGTQAAVAYNSTNDEFLIVWEGEDNTPPLVENENEIFGQRIDAETGAAIGPRLRLSDMGPNGDPAYDARSPAVAYNATQNEYLVVWVGDDDTGLLLDGEDEIYGQRVDAATGTEVGANDFRISDMGPDGATGFDADVPDVAYSPTAGEYLVVWEADDDTGLLIEGENEIFVQRIDAATGTEVGANDLRVSDMGTDGDNTFDARDPAVAWSFTHNEYLVVWEADDNTGLLTDGENEIWGQRIDATTGTEVGSNDFRISDMGPDANTTFDARMPDVVFNVGVGEYLVVWEGDDDTPPLVGGEDEIFGQRIDGATGGEVGSNDFRVSDMGPNGSDLYAAGQPAVAYDPVAGEYLVIWEADDDGSGLTEGEHEIFLQRLDSLGNETGVNDVRLTDLGAEGSPLYDAEVPALAYGASVGAFAIVFHGDDDRGGMVDEELEVFGQLLWGDRLGVAVDGACPGTVEFAIASATPGGFVGLAGAPAVGSSTVPGGSCAGTELGLSNPIPIAGETADGGGGVTIELTVPAPICSAVVQVLDLSSCEVSNVSLLPDA